MERTKKFSFRNYVMHKRENVILDENSKENKFVKSP